MRFIDENKIHEFVELLKKRKISPNSKDQNDMTFLNYALICERIEIVIFLMDQKTINPFIKCTNSQKNAYDIVRDKKEQNIDTREIDICFINYELNKL